MEPVIRGHVSREIKTPRGLAEVTDRMLIFGEHQLRGVLAENARPTLGGLISEYKFSAYKP